MRNRYFSTQKVLPKDHYLRKIPGAWKYPGLIARNVENIINSRPHQNTYQTVSGEEWFDNIMYRGNKLKDYLTPYQKIVLTKYIEYEAVYLKWAGGAGKTLASLLWAYYNYTPGTTKILVITTSGAKAQWEMAAKEVFGGKAKVSVLYGESPLDIDQTADLLIVNYDIIAAQEMSIESWFLGKTNRIFISDEIHKLKNWRRAETVLNDEGQLQSNTLSTTAAVGNRIARLGTRRLGLSATPYSIGVGDLWAQLDCLEPDCWGDNWQFVHGYCDAMPGARGGLDTTGESNVDELRQRLRSMMHTVSRTELERSLPGKRRELIRLSKEQLNAAHKEAKEELRQAMKLGEESFWEAQVGVAASMKRNWTVDTVVQTMLSGRRCVVLTSRRAEVDNIAIAVKKKLPKELKDNVLYSHGGSELSVREKHRLLYKDFTNKTMCLIGTHDAWGTAIDGLQSTDVAIMNSLPTTAKTIGQSETRFTRQGQDRPVTIMYPIAEGTIDEIVNSRLLSRLDTLKDLLDGESESEAAGRTLAGLDDAPQTLKNILEIF